MAITKKLINGHVRALNDEGSNKRSVRIKTDMKGLYMVVTNKGRCTWVLMYSFKGQPRNYSFAYYDNGVANTGELPLMTELQAFDEVIRLKAEIKSGIDVKRRAEDKTRHRRELEKLGINATAGEFTVNDVMKYFIEKVAKKRWKDETVKDSVRSYDKHIRNRIGHAAWDEVSFSQWRDELEGIANGRYTGREAPNVARKLTKLLKQAFDEAVYSEKVTRNDIKSVVLSRVAPAGKARDRTLNEFELGQVWEWCRPCETIEQTMTMILLSTNARTSEVRLSQIQEWDLTTGVWTVPNEHSKNGERIVRPIPAQITEVIEMMVASVRFAHEGKDEDEFNRARLIGKTYNKQDMSNLMSDIHHQLGMAKFTAHDLRRTCSTMQNELGLEPTIIESLLGHTQKVIRRTYNHSTMLGSKIEVLEAWHDHLELCREKYLQLKEESERAA